ncbi:MULTISPECIES: putative bifunctional diguanylate cyclase/phosphodiesterase [unclassified Bradyrhizobium]|uniref:putative bifunctional diguanylate cyclase/phosphodiesterase n=1 Tax=unclassified Bradyrhizobium TaxID=2631580 RepID=UPI002916CA59|nr:MULTISPECIES: EAL domain-containing protein [unclassified Bradyrhizobium]
MLTILSCLPADHDLRYVAAALLVCVLGSILSMRLLARVRRNAGLRRFHLLFLAGLVAGGTVWTTHFAAVLGYDTPGYRSFEPAMTFASLGLAVAFAWLGFFITTRTQRGPLIEAGGAVFGFGIASMHYSGMSALKLDGVLTWNVPMVWLSIALATVFGAVAANRIARPVTRFCKYGSSLAMVLAILSLHFTGMLALTLAPMAASSAPVQSLSDSLMLVTVVTGIGLIMAMAASAYMIDMQATQEAVEGYRQLALQDPLTGLPNRSGLGQRLAPLLTEGDETAHLAVLAIDLDRFKDVNDAHGHAAGDAVLTVIAQRIASTLQPGEFLARIGGDEFVAVKSEIFACTEAAKFAERMRALVLAPVEWEERSLSVGCSIGIALHPDHGLTSDELLTRADLAMYRAKSLGQGKICTYEPSMDEASRRRAELAIDLKRALVRNEFELHYQVQNDTQSGGIVGFEALLRWNHPVKGRVPPNDFIPMAEQTGLIVDIGDWVLRTACATAATWSRPFKVAVNVAPMQLNHDLPKRVAEVLRETGLAPERLEIELTETGIIADRQHALQVMQALKAIGVTVAMDDFGTGYSSLSTLQVFPFDKIKVDKSFIQSVETSVHAAAIVKATLLLGRSLNIPVLAEGVETEQHLAFLREEGCSSVQGFLFGKPMPQEAISRMIREVGGTPAAAVDVQAKKAAAA